MSSTKDRVSAVPRPPMDDDPVVKGILRAISLKRIRPGTKLGEDRLSEVFGTSRLHIRQVLAHLGSRNVITLYPNRGAYVASPTAEEAGQVFATRRLLEVAVVSDLVERLTDATAAELRAHVETEAAHAHDDRWNTLSLTGDFHTLLARLTGNRVLTRFLDELTLRTSLIIAAFEPRGDVDCLPDAHPAIARRIIARDKPGACAAMMEHLQAMERRLRLDAPPAADQDIASVFADLGVAAGGEPQGK